MSKHLPECPVNKRLSWFRQKCICPALCACEQRVNSSNLTMWNRTQEQAQHIINAGLGIAWKDGFKDGLNAAREAVEAIQDALQTHYRIDCEPVGKVDWSQHRGCDPVDDILAAIDALRKDSNATVEN